MFLFQTCPEHQTIIENFIWKRKTLSWCHNELDKEYEKNPTLKNKFFWVSQKEYSDNRKKCFSMTPRKRSEINHAFFFIREFARENQFSVSEVDIKGLSYAYVLKIPSTFVNQFLNVFMLYKRCNFLQIECNNRQSNITLERFPALPKTAF